MEISGWWKIFTVCDESTKWRREKLLWQQVRLFEENAAGASVNLVELALTPP